MQNCLLTLATGGETQHPQISRQIKSRYILPIVQGFQMYAARGHRLVDKDISPDVVSEVSRKNLKGSLL